jgi:hypothetical protein
MTTAFLLLLSAALILAGIGLIWRDVHRKDREAFLVRGDPSAPRAEVEVTVARRAPDGAPAFFRRARAAPPAEPRSDPGPGADPETAAETAAQWAVVDSVLAKAVAQVNAVLAGAGVVVGAPGAPSWSLARGYGDYRRVLIGGESVAWLRIELGTDGQLTAGVKAHKDEFAAVNAGSSAQAHGLDVAAASDLLSECLKPAASLAVRAANGVDTEEWASEAAWKEIDPVVAAALLAANGALAQAGARFLPLGAPAWAPEVRRHRLSASVEVFDAEVARLQIERAGDAIEVAVGVPDARLAELGRRDRLALRGVTTHALAELIAGCAWPAIAHFRETRQG